MILKNTLMQVVKEELKEGEIYAGTIINPDYTGHHIILLPGDSAVAGWKTQMNWAKSIKGDLPNRVEHGLLYKHLPNQFQNSLYWSNEQRSDGSAWLQDFVNGYQDWSITLSQHRARAVRRVAI